MERWPVRMARLWLDGVNAWRLGYWPFTRLGFYPGDQFYRSRWIPRSRRDRDADLAEKRSFET